MSNYKKVLVVISDGYFKYPAGWRQDLPDRGTKLPTEGPTTPTPLQT